MSWSIGVRPPNSDLTDIVLLAAGKALYLCNSFEAKCNHILTLINLTEQISSDPVHSLEDLISRLPGNKPLYENIRNIKLKAEITGMTEDEGSALTKAREARNFIAHEGADFGSLYALKASTVQGHMVKLRSAVADLAIGDNIVSTLLYYADEPNEPIPYLTTNYSDLIDLWVFGDLATDEDVKKLWALTYHQGLPGVPNLPCRDTRA